VILQAGGGAAPGVAAGKRSDYFLVDAMLDIDGGLPRDVVISGPRDAADVHVDEEHSTVARCCH
jgi:hypothetical protein